MPANRTVSLIRVSSDDRNLEVQRMQVARWAEYHETEVAEWYEEDGISGAAARRPELDRLLADARRGRVGTLVVAALDRIGRSAIQVMNHLHELNSLGVRVVSLRESLDLATPSGRLVASVMAHVAEIERESIRERTRAGLRRAVARGRTLGRPRLTLDDATLDRVLALRDEGKSWREIHASGVYGVDAKGRRKRPAESTLRLLVSRATGTD